MTTDARRRFWLRVGMATALAGLGAAPVPATSRQAAGPVADAVPHRPPQEVQAELGDARLQGQGRLRYLGLPIYDIRLWATAPVTSQSYARAPLALQIDYARDLVGRAIAERSLSEMRRAGPLDEDTAGRWLAEMTKLFPDVRAGDRITGLHQAGESAVFFHNGKRLGEVRDARFAALFFGIWLAPYTSEPGLRRQLLGPAG